jgi:CRP-like cAMP-binding protein
MRNTPGLGWARLASAARRGDFTERLTPDECSEFESIRTFSDYSPATTLFVEQEAPDNVLFLLTGQVKLSLNSSAGRRTILGVACPGETLGLASAFSGRPYDITAETVSPCMIASIERERFLGFLKRHPSAYVNVGTRALPGMCQSLRAGAKTRSDGNRVGEACPVPAGPVCRGPADETRNTSILRAHSYRDW